MTANYLIYLEEKQISNQFSPMGPFYGTHERKLFF